MRTFELTEHETILLSYALALVMTYDEYAEFDVLSEKHKEELDDLKKRFDKFFWEGVA